MKHSMWLGRLFSLVALFGLLLAAPGAGRAQSDAHTFPETGHTVRGVFWQYWQNHGGLAQQGYPISEEIAERSDLNGQTYTVQYFERAVFEKHPENKPPYDVLLAQLGTFRYHTRYPGSAATPTPVLATPAPAAGVVYVTEKDFTFDPPTITVPVGTKVIWTNAGPTEHTVADRAGSFGSDALHPGDSFSHVFTTPGTYAYHCTLHALMDGTIVVK